MKKKKVIAIVAHDNRKKDMIEWVSWNWKEFTPHSLICTGTTGGLVQAKLIEKCRENDVIPPDITRLKSGPLGGDQQLGALICEGKVDMLIFFWDPMEAQPHDSDVKALLRLCVVWNIPMACDAATADFVISSPFMQSEYTAEVPDYTTYLNRKVAKGI